MYNAQGTAARRANPTPATVRLALDTPSRATPAPARVTQIRSRKRRKPMTATVSGPRNSMVTAMPNGIRAKDW
jgi:hypothetical protein